MALSHWLHRLTNRPFTKPARYASSARHSQRLAVELLEDRLVPSAATHLAFTTAPVVIIAGQPSTTLTVQLEDVNDTVTQAGPGGVTVNLDTNSRGGGQSFLNTNGNPLSSDTLFIAQGFTSASFKYEDNRIGSPTLTAAAAGLSSAKQQEAIDADLGVYGLNDDMTPGTLRYALTHATAGQTIAFAPGITGTIFLQSALPAITTSINLIGPGARDLHINGSGVGARNSGLLDVTSGATVTITDLTVEAANNTGIVNDGALTLQRVIVSSNHASSLDSSFPFGAAGGIYNDGTLTVENSTIANNFSGTGLGAAGIDNEPRSGGGIATITDSTLTANTGTGIANNGTMTLNRDLIQSNHASGQASFEALGAPGGICNGGTLTILASTVDSNTTTQSLVAAGIDSEAGAVTISNSTISNNAADHSNSTGGIGVHGGTLVISNSTVTHNSTNDTNTSSGGIDAKGTSVTIFDTIVAGNSSNTQNPTDVSGAFTSLGHNWIGIADSHSSGFVASDVVGTIASPKDPKLAPFLNVNGGPTATFAVQPGSPVIDAGDNTNAPATDQRGLPRIVNGTIDIGAYEFQIVLSPATLHAVQVGPSFSPLIYASFGTFPYTFAVTAGALPAGVALATNGSFSGFPTAGGTFTFSVTATDSSSGTPYSGSQTYTLVVSPPTIAFNPAPPAAPVNAAYSQQLYASGGTAPYSNYTVSAGALPPGITLSPIGLLSGTPTQAGVFDFTVSVTDSSTGTGPYTQGRQLSILITPPGFTFDNSTRVLSIAGNAAQNDFTYSQASTVDTNGMLRTTLNFGMNGVTLSVPDIFLQGGVTVIAQGRQNTATLLTNDVYTDADGVQHETSETVILGPGGGRILTPGYASNVQLNGFLTVYAYVGRADSGFLHATTQSGGANIFVTAGSYNYITGVGQYYEISGAPNVYGYSANPGDQAWHYDTASLSSFVASGNAFSYMSGTDTGGSFFNVAVGFDVVYGIATHGQSFAYLIDSPGNDVFVGYAAYSYMSGNDNAGSLFNVAEGFALVNGESFVGGTDYAYNNSPSHNILNSRWILLT